PKHRATFKRTSACRANATRCARLPGGQSSTRTCAGVVFVGCTASASRVRRPSGMSTIPTPSAPRPAVSALNSVVLPDPAGPTMATLTGIRGAALLSQFLVQVECLVQDAHALVYLGACDKAGDAYLRRADHLDV